MSKKETLKELLDTLEKLPDAITAMLLAQNEDARETIAKKTFDEVKVLIKKVRSEL